MKIKYTEGKPRIAWQNAPRIILADFTESDTVDVIKEVGEYLVECGYKPVRSTKPKEG